jgi:hypothetical protein
MWHRLLAPGMVSHGDGGTCNEKNNSWMRLQIFEIRATELVYVARRLYSSWHW